MMVPFHTSENKLVITREYRVPLDDYEVGFPAGLVDAGESVEQAVRRELKEETGLNLSRVICTSPPLYPSAGMTDESVIHGLHRVRRPALISRKHRFRIN